jgi:ABC-type amino acid transport substrate-binding protein
MTSRPLVVLTLLLAACGIPRDPDGTLQRVEGSHMRVGIAEHPPWTSLGEEPSGIEVELVEEFARELNAEIQWVEGAETEVQEQMELGRLDLVIAGLHADSPWSSKVSFIQPYFTVGADEHVMAVPHGENAWIVRLERFLRSRHGEIGELLEEHAAG